MILGVSIISSKNQDFLQELNSRPASQTEIRQVVSDITGHQIDESVEIRLPIRSDYGANLEIGKEVFINSGAMFTDLGGIVIEDKVLIAPNVTIISVNHPLNLTKRRGLELKPVRIKENAWVGANATILPGVTVGKNAVVAAGAVVTKNVPDNMVVAGVPAKEIKKIGEN
ncbi:DapH/DapD/GlmU-related protein [Limosilactobacillus agrestimuris]|uniref:DapH/DapD/GlmU-related protein n=1 Tax=Limosilactobacillus agrestimuris TaxID=2941331 RepID=UPI00203C713D|nr:DapH/DapD/GlmU-related protein [Limosilactobacillus agrestimuris]